MPRLLGIASAALICVGLGCQNDQPPAPPRATVAMAPPRPIETAKPLPPPHPEDYIPPPPFDDVPLVSQAMPEQAAFVNAYNSVGRPHILLFVNRTLEGDLVPVNPNLPAVTVDRQITNNAAAGPSVYRDTTDVYLHHGQYDEAAAKSLDYEAVENIMTDWLSAGSQVQIVSPTLARQRLTDQQVHELQSGRPTVAREIAQQLDAHILVQVQAHPTQQTGQGLGIRIVAEAIDLKHDAASLARGVVDVPPPLEKTQINKYTRFLARKLMVGMMGSWQAGALPPGAAPQTGVPLPALPPQPQMPAAPQAPLQPQTPQPVPVPQPPAAPEMPQPVPAPQPPTAPAAAQPVPAPQPPAAPDSAQPVPVPQPPMAPESAPASPVPQPPTATSGTVTVPLPPAIEPATAPGADASPANANK